MSAANRRRGANAERAVCAWLRVNGWPDARRYLAGDGNQPGDIDAIPGVCIEVKDRKQSAWPTWREQALAEAGPDRIPIVVRRTRGQPDVGMWMAETDVLTGWFPLTGDCSWPSRVPGAREVLDCPRTGGPWVRTTFAELIDLLREDTPNG